MNIVGSILILLILGVTIFALPQEKKSEVATFLRNLQQWQRGKSKEQPKVSALNHLGDEIIPLLAEFLTDYELGDTAEGVMVEIDPDRAGPLIFASMPRSDRNVQYHAFKFFLRRIQNGQRFDHAQAMHDAAVRCLGANTNADAAELALLAIGLTGSSKDFPLLEKYFNNTEPIENWRASVRNASEASLARLGNDKYIENIARQLSSTVPAKINLRMAEAFVNSIREAGFSHNKRFVPLLCKKLDDQFIEMGPGSHDIIPLSPAQAAANALAYIVDGASPDATASVEPWRARCKGFDEKQ
jgi:hypothetical protein